MSKESRAVAIAGLTLFLFALMGFLKDEVIIFPFPLNEIVFAVVATSFTFWHYKKGILPYFFLLTGIIGVIGTPFFWELFLSAPSLEHFFLDYTVVDWSRLISKIFLLAAGIHFIAAYRVWYTKTIFAFGLGVYLSGFVLMDLTYMISGLFVIVLITSIRPVRQPFQWLWVLLFLLEGTKWITFHWHLG